MRHIKKGLVAAALGLFSLVGSVEAGYFTPAGTYKVTQGDTMEQVLSDMGTNNPADLRLESSPGRRFLQGKTLQEMLDAGHAIWVGDEYRNIR